MPTDEEQVLAIFEAYMGFDFDERANGYGPSEERIELYTTGALKQRALETLQARRDAGVFLEGSIHTSVESVAVDGDSAEVLICFQDFALAYFGDGSVADGTIEGPYLVGLPMRRSGTSWVVVEQLAGDAAPCDL